MERTINHPYDDDFGDTYYTAETVFYHDQGREYELYLLKTLFRCCRQEFDHYCYLPGGGKPIDPDVWARDNN